jgi:hypothetical protein
MVKEDHRGEAHAREDVAGTARPGNWRRVGPRAKRGERAWRRTPRTAPGRSTRVPTRLAEGIDTAGAGTDRLRSTFFQAGARRPNQAVCQGPAQRCRSRHGSSSQRMQFWNVRPSSPTPHKGVDPHTRPRRRSHRQYAASISWGAGRRAAAARSARSSRPRWSTPTVGLVHFIGQGQAPLQRVGCLLAGPAVPVRQAGDCLDHALPGKPPVHPAWSGAPRERSNNGPKRGTGQKSTDEQRHAAKGAGLGKPRPRALPRPARRARRGIAQIVGPVPAPRATI